MIATRLPLQAVNGNVVDSVVQPSGKHGTGKSSSHTTKRGSQQQSAVTKKLTQELREIIDNYVSDENMRSRAMDILTELGLPPVVSGTSTSTIAVAEEPAPAASSSSSTTGFTIFAENQPPPPPTQQVTDQTSAPTAIPTSAPASVPVSVLMTVDNDAPGPPRAIRRSARRASLVAGALVPLSVLEQLQPPEDTASIAMETKETKCEVKEVKEAKDTKETSGKRTRSRKAAVPAIVALTKESGTTAATVTAVTTLEEPTLTAEQEAVQSNSTSGDHGSSSSKSSNSNSSSSDNVHSSAHKASRTTEMCSPASNRLRSRRSVRQ